MKTTIACILVIILSVIAIFQLSACEASNNTATTQATVTAIEGDEVVLTDINGEMWLWEGAEHFKENDTVVITFNTMGNDNLYDDAIISIEQSTE